MRKFAVTARQKIEEAVKQKAYSFGITKEAIQPLDELSDGLLVNGNVMGERERRQYTHLKNRILIEGYQNVMDEAAYTWFNRFVALRYMEVNDYLPIGMCILSSNTPNKLEPDALTNILSIVEELDLNKERVYHMQEESQLNQLYQYLLIKQSIQLGQFLPNVFEPITDDLALLIPDALLNDNSVIRDFVTMVDEENWKEVEIVGWLYQFYISDEKDTVFKNLKKNKKIGKKEIGPATQLFTPRWIVEYMVDNSLGRLWLESYPDEILKNSLNYYVEDAEQSEEVSKELETLKNSDLNVEEISFLDPSCGSGHILVYAFDLFYKLYLSRGYREREIPKLILKNNLFGLDIDKRAAQLATFALIMKAREYDRRLFSRELQAHILSIEESNSVNEENINLFSKGENEVKDELVKLIHTFHDAKLYGSILKVPEINSQVIEKQMEFIREQAELDILTNDLIEYTFPLIEDLINQYKVLLNSTYDVVVTNPPYMGSKGMHADLKKYLKKYYPDEKSDLFAVFMEVTRNLTKDKGFLGTINQHSWMFISSFEKLRNKLLKTQTIINMIHLGTRTFEEIGGEVVQNTSFISRNTSVENYTAQYIRMVDIKNAEEKQNNFFNKENYYLTNQSDFRKIPGSPIAYWAYKQSFEIIEKAKTVEDFSVTRAGMITGDNNKFIKLWFEVYQNKIGLSIENRNEGINSKKKWFPYSKGGGFRKWYGNKEYVVNWENEGFEMRNLKNKDGKIPAHAFNLDYIFKENITWNSLSSYKFSARYIQNGFLYDASGSFANNDNKDEIYYLLGLLCSEIAYYFLSLLNPTLNFQKGNISNLPIIMNKLHKENIDCLVKKNIDISKKDWDSFETSWDFEKHPFLTYKENSSLIQGSFNKWQDVAEERFYQLKVNEEELNRIFIDIYGLQDELTPDVEEKDVTVRKADVKQDVKSFLSYLVGLMFGRYSLDKEGLAYAGGEWDSSQYKTYQPDTTNIIPLTQDEYFKDDIMNKVEELICSIYGKESLEENLRFIAEALDKKDTESSRERIRRYFMKEFYQDHVKIYQKRPIYWQFTSGKRGAFKGLMYLHRYNKNSIAQLRTDYVLHEASVLDNLISHEQQLLEDSTSTPVQKTRAQKNIDEYTKDRAELAQYDQVINHVARQEIDLDLDDGVKVNYELFQNVEVTDDHSNKPKELNVFEKI